MTLTDCIEKGNGEEENSLTLGVVPVVLSKEFWITQGRLMKDWLWQAEVIGELTRV